MRRYYGRTMAGTLAAVKRELGHDAIILETRPVGNDRATQRMHPGARYEVCAALDDYEPAGPRQADHGAGRLFGARHEPQERTAERPAGRSRAGRPATPGATPDPREAAGTLQPQPRNRYQEQARRLYEQAGLAAESEIDAPGQRAADAAAAPDSRRPAAGEVQRVPARESDLLADLGRLRAEITELLAGGDDTLEAPPHVDLADYHELIDRGVDHRVLAPHFRRWLHWRTAPEPIRHYIARTHGGPAAAMQGEALREWLWLAWLEGQGLELDTAPEDRLSRRGEAGPRAVGLIGPTGGGKTTTLAKLSSKFRQTNRQNVVIVTLDTQRFGATEQWRRCARLMDIHVEEVVSPADVTRLLEYWDRFDWVGIDTPGGMTPDSDIGRRYVTLLAHCPRLETQLVLPATHHEAVCRRQMDLARSFDARHVLFTKLDESATPGGIVNLTMDGTWKIDGLTAGKRVPEDWAPASPAALWQHVLAPAAA